MVDTSVWVSFFRGIETPYSLYLRRNLPVAAIAICPTILQEVLQGILNKNNRMIVDNYFKYLIRMPGNGYEMAEEAASIYRKLRDKGITIRKPNDCLIAAYSIKNNSFLLHDDRDFKHIAENSSLKLIDL